METYCYFNGEEKKYSEVNLHISDLAITRGYGIFDFLRSKESVPLFLSEYVDRFFRSAKELLLEIPMGKSKLSSLIWELIEENGGGEWGIRIMLTGGYSSNHFTPEKENFMILIVPMHFPSEALYQEGIHLMTYHHQRDVAETKSLNYLTPIYMRNKLAEVDAHDLLYHYHGVLTESSRSNFFLVKDGKLITPQEQILNGITRNQVIKLAKKELEVEIRTVSPDELETVDEAFITSTTKRIMPVGMIDGEPLKQINGPITQLLTERFNTFERDYIQNHQRI